MDQDPDRRRQGRPADQATATEPTAQDPGPGVHVLVAAEPLRAARNIANQLGAELADTAVTAELAVQARLGAQPDPPAHADANEIRRLAAELSDAPADPGADQRLAAQLASHRAAPAIRAPTADDPAHLRYLAAAVERAERIQRRTEEATTERLATSLNTGLAVHPDTLRRASAGVLDEQRAVAEIEAALERLGSGPGSSGAAPTRRSSSAASVRAGPERAPAGGERTPTVAYAPGSLLIAVGVVLLGVALAGGILLTSLPPVLAIAPILLGLLIGGAVRRWSREEVDADRVQASEPLSRPADPLPEGPAFDGAHRGPQSAQDRQREEWAHRRDTLAARLSNARERLEAAQRDWAALAGDDVDATDIDEVVARNDPQFGMLSDVASETVAVRTATRVVTQARQAWEAAWAELGMEAPEAATSGDALEAALSQLQDRAGEGAAPHGEEPAEDEGLDVEEAERAERRIELRAQLDELLAGRPLDDVLATLPDDESVAVPPLVLVEPFSGLGARRRTVLKEQLGALDSRLQVIVVVRDRADIP